jgi:SAM-dependent methyltransferase
LAEQFDTVVCLNVFEYLEDPAATLASLRTTLKTGGNVVLLVPHGANLYGSIDRTLGHRRRYSRREMERLLTGGGFELKKLFLFNRAGALAWFGAGKMLRRKSISKVTLKAFDKSVWLWRRVDPLLPWRGLSMIAIATRTH